MNTKGLLFAFQITALFVCLQNLFSFKKTSIANLVFVSAKLKKECTLNPFKVV